MKKTILLIFAGSLLASAGPLKVATYPLLHPKKDVQAAKTAVKAGFHAIKAMVW